MEIFEILTRCPLFRGMDAAQIAQVLSGSDNHTVRTFRRGEVIACHDQAYSGLMILTRGSAEGRMSLASGREAVIDSIEAPQLVAPAFLFGDHNRLPMNVVALSDGELMTLHRGFLFEIMQGNVLILSNFIDIISDRANVWWGKLHLLLFRSLKEKAALWLLQSGGERIALDNMTLLLAAESFGVARSSLQRMLDVMAYKHLISIDKESITLLNRGALEALLK